MKKFDISVKKAIEAKFMGKSKREMMAIVKEHGYRISSYVETGHDIPQWASIWADGYLIHVHFEKKTRRIA